MQIQAKLKNVAFASFGECQSRNVACRGAFLPARFRRGVGALIAVFSTYLFVSFPVQGRGFYPSTPKTTLETNQAAELVRQQYPALIQEPETHLVAIVWSGLSSAVGNDQKKYCFYREPLSGRELFGFAGGNDEWSWFVTYVTKNPDPLSYSRGALQQTITFQVLGSGKVKALSYDD